MKPHRRVLLLSCCVILLTGLLAAFGARAWGPPRPMAWDTFYALYEAAGGADDPADRVVTLTGPVRLSDGTYELGPTLRPVTVNTPGRFSFEVMGDSTLRVDNPDLTVYAEDNAMAAFIVSGGYLDLRTCAIETHNASAVSVMSTGDHLTTGGGGRVTIDAAFEGEAVEGGVRAGILTSGFQDTVFQLHNVDLTVTGGDTALRLDGSLELYDCTVRAVSDPPVPAVQFFYSDSTLTADETTVIEPAWEATPPPVEPPADPRIVDAVFADGPDLGWSLAGTRPADLPLPEAGTVWCSLHYEDGVPLLWALEDLPDPLTAGEYALRGVPDPAALASLDMENPDNVAGEYLLTVWDPAPPGGMTVESNPIEDGAARRATYKNLPPLAASGAEAVHVEYSPDGTVWRRVQILISLPYEDEPRYSDDLLDDPWVDEETTEFTLDVPAAGFYTRLVVVGGPFAGVSNTVDHGAVLPPEPEDDGNSGDHGGGGQGEHGRPGKEDPKPSPEPTTTPEPSPSPTPVAAAVPSPTPASSDAQAPASSSSGPEPAPTISEPPRRANTQPPAPARDSQNAPSVPGEDAEQALAATEEQALSAAGEPPAPAVSRPAGGASRPDAPAPSPSVPPAAGAAVPDANTPVSEPVTAGGLPGFAIAAGATILVLLGAASWFHLHGKRK